MELRHLRYFVAVAEELNFSRAAQRLHIAQPPLSQQIRDLEEELGVMLFERTKRRVELTVPGEIFLDKVRQTIEQVEQAVAAVKRASRGELGRLSIGFNSSATYSVLPTLLRAFRENCSDVELDLQELTTHQQLVRLHHRQIDVGILYLPIETEVLNVMSVLKEVMVVAMPETHSLATLSQVSIRLLNRGAVYHATPILGGGLYSQIMQFFQQTGFSPIIAQQATQLQTIISLVAGGVGVALVPASMQNLQRSGVVYLSLQELTPEVEIAVAWRRHDHSPVLRKLIEAVCEVV